MNTAVVFLVEPILAFAGIFCACAGAITSGSKRRRR